MLGYGLARRSGSCYTNDLMTQLLPVRISKASTQPISRKIVTCGSAARRNTSRGQFLLCPAMRARTEKCALAYIPKIPKAIQQLCSTAAGVVCELAVFCFVCFHACSADAQDNYEIQVYASETVPAGRTMIELHSNFTLEGERETVNGVLPSHHALHETLEITRGFTPWFEPALYIFSSAQPGKGWEWVGDHIRPRVRIPEDWKWPLGLSLSTEFGYQRRVFSEDTWTWELRPIIDKQWGRWYFAVNPSLEKSIHGAHSNEGFEFAPSAKISFDITKVVALGAEYYSSLGKISHFNHWNEQEHQIMPVLDLNFSPDWEFNFGVGVGLTRSTDDLLVKLILGRRF